MEEGEEDDPFGSIAKFCRVSPSQESILCRRRFRRPDRQPASSSSSTKDDHHHNLESDPAESSRIVTESSSESMEEENSHPDGVFVTPPDGSVSSDHREYHPTVEEGSFIDANTVLFDSGSIDTSPVVDSASGTDLGLLQENLKSMQVDLGENAAFQSEPDEEARVSSSRSVSSPISQPLEDFRDGDTVRLDSDSMERFPVVDSTIGTALGFLQEHLKSMQVDLVENATFQTEPDEAMASSSTSLSSPISQPMEDFRDGGTVPVDSGSMDRFPVVDSARDADLGLFQKNLKSIEVDLGENAAFQSKPDEARVSSSSSPIEQSLDESQSKRLKITDVKSPDLHPETVQEIPNFFEKLNSSSSPGNASAANPRYNDEAGEDVLTGREALMKSFENLNSKAVNGDNEPEWNRCEMEKKADEKRVLPSSITASIAPAASETDVMKEATAFSAPSSQGTAQDVAEVSLADVLKALGKDDPNEQNLRHLSLMDIARGRGMILTPSWWPKEGLKVKR